MSLRSFAVRACAFTVLVAGIAACTNKLGASGSASTNHAPSENTSTPVDALDDSTHPGLSGCASGDVSGALQIAQDYKVSTHELIVCGGLATNLGSGIVSVLLNAAIGGTNPSFTFDAATSTYVTGAGATGSAGTVMHVTAMLGADTSFGKKGDVIKLNLLDVATYFTGLKATAKASINTSGEAKTSLTLEYTGVGAGVEILGLGKTPANPLVLDANAISANIGSILVKVVIHVDDKQGSSLFSYDVDTPVQTLSASLAGDPVAFQLKNVSGTHGAQSLAITKWEIGYLDTGSSGYMDGTIGFSVTGGAFPYDVTFNYPRRKTPDVALACHTGK